VSVLPPVGYNKQTVPAVPCRFGNFAGCGIFVGLMYASGIYEGNERYLEYLVHAKTHHTWVQVFVRGIFANWLVGIATWMANAAQV
jgi:formate/nitrite transporter FocA (FNT family)